MTSLARPTVFNLATILSSVSCGMLLSVLAARLWPTNVLADYLYLSWLAATLATAAGAAFPALAVRLVAESRGRGEEGRARRVLGRIAIAVAILAAIIGTAAAAIDNTASGSHLLGFDGARLVLVALTGGQALSSLLTGAAQGAGRFDLVFRRTLASVVLALVVACALVVNGQSAVSVLATVAAGHLTLTLLLGRDLRREFPATAADGGGPPFAEIRGYLLMVTGIVLLDQIVWQRSELFFLRRYSTALELARYAVAFAVANTTVRMAPAALSGVLTPAFATLAGSRRGDEVLPLYRRAVILMATASGLLVIIALGLGRTLLGLWGPDFVAAWPLLPLLAVGFIAGNLSGVSASVFHGFGRADLLLKAGALMAAANLTLDWLLVPRWGALGAAIACGAAQALSLPIIATLGRRALGLELPLWALGRLAAAVSAGLFIDALTRLSLLPGLGADLAATTAAMIGGGLLYVAVGGPRDLRHRPRVEDPPEATDPTPAVSIVIPSKNRLEFVERAVRQVLAQDGPPREVIVVDSSDGEETQAMLAARFPEVRRVRVRGMPNNRHFAKNQGIRLARGRVVCFLDDDSFAEPGWLGRHLAQYDDPAVGAVGGRIIDEVFALGPVGERVGQLDPNGRLHLNFTRHTGQVIDVDHFIGCNMSFRATSLAAVGGFDLGYGGPNFMEETDLCIRVKRAGFRVRFDPDAVVHHANAPRDGGLERRALDPRGELWSARSRTYFALKLLPRTIAVLRYNVLGFLKLHLLRAIELRSPHHAAAFGLQLGGSLLGAIDWLTWGRPRVAPK